MSDASELEKEVELLRERVADLQGARDYLENLVNYANAPIVVWDPDLRITRFNRAFERLTGYAADEIIGQEVAVLLPEIARGESLRKIVQASVAGHWESEEIPILCKNGDTRIVLWNSANVAPEDGAAPLATIAQGHDISERKEAERRTRRLTRVLRAVRNVNQLITKEKDRDRLLRGSCENLIKTRGYHRVWIALLDPSHRLLTASAAGFKESYLAFVEHLKRGELPYCVRKALGQSGAVWIEDPSVSCPDCPLSEERTDSGALTTRLEHEGRVHGVLSATVTSDFVADEEEFELFEEVAADIAFALSQIEAEGALRRSEARFSELVDALPQTICEMDEDGAIAYLSDHGLHAFGYTREDLEEGLHALQMLIPEDRERAQEDFGRLLGGERLGAAEYTALRKDGTAFPVLSYSTPLVRTEEPRRVRSIVVDITKRKEEERALREMLDGLIRGMGLTTKMRDPYTAKHQQRVTELACAIASEMALAEEQVEGIRVAGLLHDIGKIAVPAEVLAKPSELTGPELELIKAHPQLAYEILLGVDFSWPVADVVLQHHERLDGSGYPHGLKGDDIRLEARILAVADVVEAMASHRPYRAALGIDAALEEIEEKKGLLYDPEVVDVCRRLFREERFRFQSDDEPAG